MGGYQLMVSADIFRGRYRESFETAEGDRRRTRRCRTASRCRRRTTSSCRATGSWCRCSRAGSRSTTATRRRSCRTSSGRSRPTTARRRSASRRGGRRAPVGLAPGSLSPSYLTTSTIPSAVFNAVSIESLSRTDPPPAPPVGPLPPRYHGSAAGSAPALRPRRRFRRRPASGRSPASGRRRAAHEIRPTAAHQRSQHLDSGLLGPLQDCIGDLRGALARDRTPVVGAVGNPHAGPEEPQIIVDLGDRPDRRAGILSLGLLLDRDSRDSPSIASTSGFSIKPRN